MCNDDERRTNLFNTLAIGKTVKVDSFFLEWICDLFWLDDEVGFELCKLESSVTNLSVSLWYDEHMSRRNLKHTLPIIRASKGADRCGMIPISISKTPEWLIPDFLVRGFSDVNDSEWKEIFDYIARHYEIFMRCWRSGVFGMDIRNIVSGHITLEEVIRKYRYRGNN